MPKVDEGQEITQPRQDTAARSPIRPARPEDARQAAELIYLPMGKLADYLFGSCDSARAKEVLATLFAQEENRFSYQFADVIDTSGFIAGLLLGFPGATLKETEIPTAKQLHAVFSLGEMWRFLRRSLLLMRYKEAEPDEFYIFTLAVKPECQSDGLGSRLLDHAASKARGYELAKCSLGVAIDNDRAIEFYRENGFDIVETVQVPPLERAIRYPGYHRMVKILE